MLMPAKTLIWHIVHLCRHCTCIQLLNSEVLFQLLTLPTGVVQPHQSIHQNVSLIKEMVPLLRGVFPP